MQTNPNYSTLHRCQRCSPVPLSWSLRLPGLESSQTSAPCPHCHQPSAVGNCSCVAYWSPPFPTLDPLMGITAQLSPRKYSSWNPPSVSTSRHFHLLLWVRCLASWNWSLLFDWNSASWHLTLEFHICYILVPRMKFEFSIWIGQWNWIESTSFFHTFNINAYSTKTIAFSRQGCPCGSCKEYHTH